jgi:ribonuclease HI
MTWDDCKAQVDGFPGAEYKSFADPADAATYLGIAGGASAEERFPEGVRAYVDGSFDAASDRFSCGVVMVRTDAEGNVKTRELNQAFDDAEMAKQRNIAGEIMGAKMAVDFCMRQGIPEVEIYHDYEGVGKWADGLWKANNPMTQAYVRFIEKARTVMKITFVKVTAHAGNKYNEKADKLAKEALGI